uniref:Unannotated protein n=1 Tax=freshwater metagenome TaxID=449393 RepID=A0A6J7Q801_9ZZZZ
MSQRTIATNPVIASVATTWYGIRTPPTVRTSPSQKRGNGLDADGFQIHSDSPSRPSIRLMVVTTLVVSLVPSRYRITPRSSSMPNSGASTPRHRTSATGAGRCQAKRICQ